METIVNGLPISYEVYGSGEPVVMLHGWSVDHRLMRGCMEPVFEGLETPWQRIYLDLPGMGKTSGAPWINGSDAMLDVVLKFIDNVLPGQRFVVAGESYGGYLARGVIKARRERVDGILLICPVADQETRLTNAPAFEVLEKDEVLLSGLTEEERAYFTGVNVVQNRRVWQRFASEVMSGLQIADYAFLENSLSQNVPYRENVDQVEQPYRQPALFVMGRQDHMVGYRDQWQLMGNYPRASFVILDKAGHNLQIEQGTLFTALVKEWLERVRAESR